MTANSPGWRRLNNAVHRDLGYLACVLTILYGVSGIAVNHVEDWNPSYAAAHERFTLTPPAAETPESLQNALISKLGLDPASVQGWHRPAPDRFVIFLPQGGEAKLDLSTGQGVWKKMNPRPFLFDANVLHLNHIKGVWTYVADAYSLVLIVLAATGLFVLRGDKGLLGRGKWWVAAGAALPAAFVVYYHFARS